MKPTFNILLNRLARAQQERLRPFMETIPLSIGQPKVLRYLYNKTSCVQVDIANYYNIKPATVSRLLDGLEKDGLVSRSQIADNRRAIAITITPKGKKAYEQWTEYCKNVVDETLEGFSEEEKKQFASFMKRAYANLTGKTFE